MEQFKRQWNRFNSRWGVINSFFSLFSTLPQTSIYLFSFFSYRFLSFLFLIALPVCEFCGQLCTADQLKQPNGFLFIVFIYMLIFHSIISVVDAIEQHAICIADNYIFKGFSVSSDQLDSVNLGGYLIPKHLMQLCFINRF